MDRVSIRTSNVVFLLAANPAARALQPAISLLKDRWEDHFDRSTQKRARDDDALLRSGLPVADLLSTAKGLEGLLDGE
jgi:hypothetical protein